MHVNVRAYMHMIVRACMRTYVRTCVCATPSCDPFMRPPPLSPRSIPRSHGTPYSVCHVSVVCPAVTPSKVGAWVCLAWAGIDQGTWAGLTGWRKDHICTEDFGQCSDKGLGPCDMQNMAVLPHQRAKAFASHSSPVRPPLARAGDVRPHVRPYVRLRNIC